MPNIFVKCWKVKLIFVGEKDLMETVKLGLLIKKTKVARCGKQSYPVLSITKQNGIIMQSEKFKKRIASADTSDYKIIPRGKLVQGIHIDEGNFGIQDIVDNGIVSPAYGVWDVNDGLVIPKYLEMVLRSPKSIEFYRSKLTGTVNRRGHMSDTDFLSMDIPLSDRDTQSKILKTMKKTTSILCFRQQQLAKLDELIKARFIEMFGHQSHNEKSLPYMAIDDVAEIYLGITHTPTYVDSGVMFISAKNTSGDFLDLSDVKYISREEFERAPKGSKPQVNDVLFSRVGSNLGHPVILKEELELCTFVSLGFLRSKGFVTSNYLKHWMRDEFFAKQVSEHVKGGGQPNLNTGWLKEFKIIVPDLEKQKEFDDFCSQVDKSKAAVQKSLDETQVLFDSLMQKYFG